MGHNVTCSDCGESYYSVGAHRCPGTDRERIEALEEKVAELEEELRATDQRANVDAMVNPGGDVEFMRDLVARSDWAKLPDDVPAPISVGEFRRCMSIMGSAIQANMGIIEDMKRTYAALGIRMKKPTVGLGGDGK